MLRIFCGYDPRQPLAYNVLQHSVAANAGGPVSITPLILRQLPIQRRGLTEFTFSRFLPPYLCGYEGISVFMDADMVVTGDVYELIECVNGAHDVYVNKSQQPFEWPSVMVFDNTRCKALTPEFIDDESQNPLKLEWAKSVGDFPAEWNRAVGYTDPAPSKLYHYTMGIPCWKETRNMEPEPWIKAYKSMIHSVSWRELMGNSVHAQHVNH